MVLTKNEEAVLRNKYNYDSFIYGKKKCEEVIRLKKVIKDNKIKMNKKHKEKSMNDIKKLEYEKIKMKRFLDGLKNNNI